MTLERARQLLAKAGLYLLAGLVLTEAALRLQQRLGPLLDLDIRPESAAIGSDLDFSDTLNHVATPGKGWDADGIAEMDEPNASNCAPKMLFMGDSFMQGLLGKHDTVPLHVRDYFAQALGREVCVFNAGHVSYSPSIYVVQARQLIPRLHPDIVLIDVDETDLYDDYYRYRGLSRHDASDSIVAVRATPTFVQFHTAMVASSQKLLYLHRLLDQLYVTHVYYPKIIKKYNIGREHDLFFASRLPEVVARQEYAQQIAYFGATLDDLTNTVLRQIAGDASRLIYLHHPHLEHLQSRGDIFNNIVSETVAEVAARYHVAYYDATDDLRTQMGDAPSKYYMPNDMHFSAAGYRLYGIDVAKYLANLPAMH